MIWMLNGIGETMIRPTVSFFCQWSSKWSAWPSAPHPSPALDQLKFFKDQHLPRLEMPIDDDFGLIPLAYRTFMRQRLTNP
jgi:hypothetical protein